MCAHFAHEHAYAAEALPDDHPDLQAYRAGREAQAQQPTTVELLEERIATLETRVRDLTERTR